MSYLQRILVLISFATVITVSGQTESRNKIEFSVEKEYWEGCETGDGDCNPLLFERSLKHDLVLLKLPCGGTSTTVHLTKNDETIKTLNIDHADCPPVFDLTELEDGQYGAYMFACGLGGPIKFTLKTKRE